VHSKAAAGITRAETTAAVRKISGTLNVGVFTVLAPRVKVKKVDSPWLAAKHGKTGHFL
jgi:hypothetical protein